MHRNSRDGGRSTGTVRSIGSRRQSITQPAHRSDRRATAPDRTGATARHPVNLILVDRGAMPYSVGDPVVFADHGATLVHELRTRVIAGVPREYVVLRYPYDTAEPDLVALVPVDGGLLAPLQEVAGPTGVQEALALLRLPGPHRESRYPERRCRYYLILLGGLDD